MPVDLSTLISIRDMDCIRDQSLFCSGVTVSSLSWNSHVLY